MAGESAAHMRLVVALADLVEAAGYAVTEIDVAGERQPRAFGGHRPDLLAQHLVVRVRLIGEAKLADDLFTRRSLRQFETFARVLVPHTPPTYAHLVVAVPREALNEAWRALALARVTGPNVTVVAQAEESWLITFRPQDGAASWRGFALRT